MTATATAAPSVAESEAAEAAPVVAAGAHEAPALARVLARAFADDPVAAWFFPDPASRVERLEWMHRLVSLPDALRDGECFRTSALTGVAVWVPASREAPGALEELRRLPTVARLSGRHTWRALRGLARLESLAPERPHAHLTFIGTEPARRGEGIGSRLLGHTLARLDRAGTPAYLEASSPRNRSLYRRHGFADLGEVRLPGGGPPMWRMWREPHAAGVTEAGR